MPHAKAAPYDRRYIHVSKDSFLGKMGIDKFPRVPSSTNFYTEEFQERLVLNPWKSRNTSSTEDATLDGSMVLLWHGHKRRILLGVGVGGAHDLVRRLREKRRPMRMSELLREARLRAKEMEKKVVIGHTLGAPGAIEPLTLAEIRRDRRRAVRALRFAYLLGDPKVPPHILKEIRETHAKRHARSS